MTRSYRRSAAIGIAALTAALLPLTGTPAFASTEVVTTAPLAAPTGLAPVDNPDDFTPPHAVRKDIWLHWNAVSGATGYRVEIGRDQSWSDESATVLTYDLAGTTQLIPVGDLPYGTYAWRVAALKGSAVGHWTSESTNSQNRAEFTKGWRAAPVSLAPTGGITAQPSLSWSNVGEAALYEVQIATSSWASSAATANPDTSPTPVTQPVIVKTCETNRTRLVPFSVGESTVGDHGCAFTPVTGTDYYWRVRAVDESSGASERGNWSAEAHFVAAAPAGPASTVTPTHMPTTSLASDPDKLCSVSTPDGTAEKGLCTDVPTLQWSTVSGATTYKLVIALDDELTNIVETLSTPWNSWTTSVPWPEAGPSTSYYYDVQACNSSEECTPHTSTPKSFRKVSPRLSSLSTPAATGDAVFTWSSYAAALSAAEQAPGTVPASQDAKGYHLQVAPASHPGYDVVTLDVTVDGVVPLAGDYPSTTNPTYLNQDLADGSYVWRVQAVDAALHKLPWSLSKAFTRDSTAPRLLSVSPSYKVGVTQPLKLTFSEPVTGVSASTISVSPSVGYTVTVTSSTTATLTPSPRWLPGATYTVRPLSTVKDGVGNSAPFTGPSFTVNPLVDDPSSAIGYSSGWRVLSATNAVGGTFHNAASSSTVRPYALMTFHGTGVSLTSCLGPNNGYVDVLVDGVRKGRVSTYRSYSGCGIRVLTASGLARGQHTVRVVAVGAHAAGSGGNTIALDALTVTP